MSGVFLHLFLSLLYVSTCVNCDFTELPTEKCTRNNSCALQIGNTSTTSCPAMYHCNGSSQCECISDDSDTIRCDDKLLRAAAILCTSVMYDSQRDTIAYGSCLVQCGLNKQRNADDAAYYDLPMDIHELNATACREWNREGMLCGQCKKGFYPQAYSYDRSCVSEDKCRGRYGDWWKYIFAAYGPLTVFYILLLLLRINVASSYMLPYVIFCQTLSSRYVLWPTFSFAKNYKTANDILKILATINSIWTLDFFKSFYSICLKVDTLTVVVLEYCIALHPFLLGFITHRLIKLYDRKIPVLVAIWKRFKFLLSFLHKNIDSKTTIVDVYTTFFFLSYSRIADISFTLLLPSRLHYTTTKNYKLVLFFDGTKDYFQAKHIPYAFIAILMTVSFNIVPFTIFLFYHTKCFQKILSCFPCNFLPLKVTMDLLQRCYKDGVEEGTKDYRWFLGTFLAYWIIIYIGYAYTLNATFFIYTASVCVLFLGIIAYLQPYKKQYSHFLYLNFMLYTFLAVMALFASAMSMTTIVRDHSLTFILAVPFLLLVIIPHLALLVYTIWLISRCKIPIA